jgi:protein involved in polysaccharide export with SLBB domain
MGTAAGLGAGSVGRQLDGLRELPRGQEPASSKGKDGNSSPASFMPVPEPLSPIEASYNLPIFQGQLNLELRQYGYSLFANPISTFAPVEDIPVGPDYIMGPGDDMVIRLWGSMETAFVQSVDRNGQINLPNVGPVKVWGLTFKDAGELIGKQLSRYYRGLQTSVTMGRLRAIRVYVVGEVCQPGSYTLSSLSTVTNALFSAGGPVKLGSLRNVQLKRNHHTVGTLDLYDFLLRGDKTRDFRLEPGDTIFIPPIGSIAAITGEVKRPAIYEISDRTRVSDLIEMAGGTTPRSYVKRVQVLRNKPNSEREVIDLDLTAPGSNGNSPMDIEVRNGDLVTIYPTDPRIYNTVRLAGAVKHPGEYEFKSDMRLSQLVQKATVLPEAHLEQVEIARLKNDLTTEILQVNLKEAWSGKKSEDLTLQPLDQITLRSEYRNPWSVTVGGEVKRPGTYTIKQGERLSSVLKRAGGFTDKAYPKGSVFTRETVRQVERGKLDQFMRGQQERMLAEASTIGTGLGSINKEEAAAQQSVLNQRLEQIQVLASRVTLGRVVLQLDDLEKLEGSPNDLVLENGDSLNIPLKPASVMVVGSVRNPTSVLHKENEDVQYYLNRAGGLSPGSAEKEMYLVKADGSAITGFLRLRNVEAGDVIVVPPSIEAKTRWLDVWKDLFTIGGQAALGVAAIAGIVALR